MPRRSKIALIGASGWDQAGDKIVHCYPWHRLTVDLNLRDYDTLVINLVSLPANPAWDVVFQILTLDVAYDILLHDGWIIVLGDPRIEVSEKTVGVTKVSFLDWTGWQFRWDNNSGDSVIVDGSCPKLMSENLQNYLKHWEYSLRDCSLNEKRVNDVFPLLLFKKDGLRVNPNVVTYARNRYGGRLALSFNFSLDRKVFTGYGERWDPVVTNGPITLLPQTDLGEDQTMQFILRDIVGVATELREPEWLSTLEAPGQKDLDERIARLQNEILEAEDQVKITTEARIEIRKPLRLLYDRGQSLERVTRSVLAALGADVEEPTDPSKEDGWITVKLGDGRIFEGVLEIKSTKNEQFDQGGLRQLLDWVNRGVEMRKKKFKGMFIGLNAADSDPTHRPAAAFSDDWKKNAELQSVVALRTDDLYALYVLKCSGKLDTEKFWSALFGTNGIFDARTFLANPETNEPNTLL